MKTTLDLPDPLMREVKVRAAREGRKLKDLVAELLRVGLDAPAGRSRVGARVLEDPELGIPVIVSPAGAAASRMTCDELLRLEAEATESDDFDRAGLPL